MEKLRIEIEIEDRPDVKTVEVEAADLGAVLEIARDIAGFENAYVFERDADETVGEGVEKRRAISLLVTRCHRVAVTVRYEHRTETREFSPAATVLRVLHWATGKKAFDLDDNATAKANLILPGADQPLPKDSMIGRNVKHEDCALVVDLTLKDFTNG